MDESAHTTGLGSWSPLQRALTRALTDRGFRRALLAGHAPASLTAAEGEQVQVVADVLEDEVRAKAMPPVHREEGACPML